MTRPGDRLRAISARVFSAPTMERLIDPVLADLQSEYAEAILRGRPWRSRWVRLAGYVAFLKVIALHGCKRSIRPLRDWTADDDQALGRTIKCAAASMVAVTLLLNLPLWLRVSSWMHASDVGLLAYSIPQTLLLATPVGFTLGIFCGLGGRAFSSRLAGPVLGAALACSIASFAMQIWIVPAANHALRLSIAERDGMIGSLKPGPSQRELHQAIDLYSQAQSSPGFRHLTSQLTFEYHMGWALSGATFALALFALSVVTRRSAGRLLLAGAAAGALVGYWCLLMFATVYAYGTLPAIAAAWLPNVVFVILSTVLPMLPTPRETLSGSL
jgi:hypothetical protein